MLLQGDHRPVQVLLPHEKVVCVIRRCDKYADIRLGEELGDLCNHTHQREVELPNDSKTTPIPLGLNVARHVTLAAYNGQLFAGTRDRNEFALYPIWDDGIACETVARYGGALPNEADELLSFKGIGRYTAGAIRSFAFNQDAAILDTNVIRVLHRVFIGEGDPKTQRARLWNLSEALIPKGQGYNFNQALMDFGATICAARDPYCLLCPMKDLCKTYPFDKDGK